MSSSHLAERQGNHLANETKAIGSVAFQNPSFPKGDNDFDNSPVTTEVVAIRDLVIVSRMDRADVSSAPNFNILRNKLTAPPSFRSPSQKPPRKIPKLRLRYSSTVADEQGIFPPYPIERS